MTQTKKRRLPHLDVTAKVMKIYAAIFYAMYLLSESILKNGVLHAGDYTNETFSQMLSENPDQMMIGTWASILQLLGGLALPVLAFLLVEGFTHTKDNKKYFLKMLGMAVLAEIPYEYALAGKLSVTNERNLFFTLVISLLMLYGLRYLKDKKGLFVILGRIALVGAAYLWTVLINSQFGGFIAVLCAIYYIFYDNHNVKLWCSALISIFYVTAPFSAYLIAQYNGKRGEIKYANMYYFLYLIELGICIVANLLLR